MLRRISSLIAISFLNIVLIAMPFSASEQDPAQAQPPSDDSARIDQIFKECSELIKNGQFDDLLKQAEDALSLSQKINDKARQARALNYVGTVRFHQAHYEEAAEVWKQAALLFGQANDKKKQIDALIYSSAALKSVGQYEDAHDTLNRAIFISREIGDRRSEAQIVFATGAIYQSLGDYDRAESSFQFVLRTGRELRQPSIEFSALMNLADVESNRRRYQIALKYLEQASAVDSSAINHITRKALLKKTATIYVGMGEHQKALDLYQKILESATSENDSDARLLARANMSWPLHQLRRSQEGLESLAQAHAMLRQLPYDPTREAELYLITGHIQKDLHRYEEALASYRKALARVEQSRPGLIPTEILRGSFADKYRDAYIEMVDVLFALDRQSEALEIAEAYHGRAFLDMLAESKIDPRRDLSAPEREREDKLFNHIYAIQKELWKQDLSREREDQAKRDLTSAEDALEAFQLEMRRANPRFASVQYPQPLKLDRIQRDLLGSDSAVIQYMLGDERSFAWAVTSGGVTAVLLPPRKEIEYQIASYRQALKERVSPITLERALDRFESQSQLLYQSLFRPLEDALGSVNKLVIIADGSLAYLPFETLLANKKSISPETNQQTQLLIERFAISYAPSASALAAIKGRRRDDGSRKGLIAFGDPVYYEDKNGGERSASSKVETSLPGLYAERGLDLNRLPYTRAEVNSIGSLFSPAQRRIYLGEEAREQTVKSAALDQYRYVHFAAHGLVDEQRPSRSGIVLSFEKESKEDGVLQMSEIMRLKLNADLVTLSACQTGLGKLLNGEGMIGLSRAFLYAGADSVVMSLWNANDSATSELMKVFYQNLHRGLTKDEALRQAKLSFVKSKHRMWRHPYFWAPFVLVGEHK